MRNPNPMKILLADIINLRGIHAAYFKLGPQKSEILDAVPITVFFDPTFLEHVTKKSENRRTFVQLKTSGERACNALILIGIKTVGQLRKRSFMQVASARGLGPSAMALTLDALQALGIVLDEEDLSVQLPAPMTKEASALIAELGI